jgi:hypothetical protein
MVGRVSGTRQLDRLACRLLNVCLQRLRFRELALHVCGKPYSGQRTATGEDSL